MIAACLSERFLQVAAQNNTTSITEGEFWSRLDDTNGLLQKAITQSQGDRVATIDRVHTLWQNVTSVRLQDGTVTPVDVSWLNPPGTDIASLQQVQQNVQALLDYHRDHASQSGNTKASLDALHKVLQDPRFHYPPPTATPPPDTSQRPNLALSPELGQLLLVTGGILSVIFLLWTFARGLRVQRAQLKLTEVGEDPKTAQAARDLAIDSESARDYRSAIRYQYLASLLMLDEHGLIHYDRSLTNREHLRQIAGKAELSDALRPVVETFDRVWYGFAPVNETVYQEFRANVERLRAMSQVKQG